MNNLTIRMTWEDGTVETSTLAEFLKANDGDPDLCDEVAAMKPGDTTEIGGGASPFCEIELVLSEETTTSSPVVADTTEPCTVEVVSTTRTKRVPFDTAAEASDYVDSLLAFTADARLQGRPCDILSASICAK